MTTVFTTLPVIFKPLDDSMLNIMDVQIAVEYSDLVYGKSVDNDDIEGFINEYILINLSNSIFVFTGDEEFQPTVDFLNQYENQVFILNPDLDVNYQISEYIRNSSLIETVVIENVLVNLT